MKKYNFIQPITSDLPEMVKNRMHTRAMNLLKDLLDDFSHQEFTLQDIRDQYGSWHKHRWVSPYGIKTLKKLVDLGLVIEDDPGVYNVDSWHPMVGAVSGGFLEDIGFERNG